MTENGSGYNGRYTAGQFIEAMEGTAGIVSALADRLGCAWQTARDGIDRWPTVKRAWENERHKVTDKARHNIIGAISDNKHLQCLQLSKWWLTMMDDEFRPEQKVDVTSGGKQLSSTPNAETVAEAIAILDARRLREAGESGQL